MNRPRPPAPALTSHYTPTGSASGRLLLQVAPISLNGRIAAVTRADLGDESVGHFRALMAPSSLREGRNDVQILLVEDEDTLKLIPRSK